MGHSHYWSNPNHNLQKNRWNNEFIPLVRKIIELSTVPVVFESDDSALPVINEDMVRFNGVKDDGYETFLLRRRRSDFEFCKTSHKPYDEIVVAILYCAADLFSYFKFDSDGDKKDHAAGIALLAQAKSDLHIENHGGDQFAA